MCNCNRRHTAITSASLAAAREMAEGNAEQRAQQSANNAVQNANSTYAKSPEGDVQVVSVSS